MTTRTAERIDGWESRPFSGGYAGLQDLAADSFSGVVRAGPATCCMLNGTVVGVVDGSIEDFEDASGTVREAPSPALPLLLVMQEGDSEVRTKYYSEDTPLSEADQKLSDGGFTGFIELSENVLSGDYYVVYHGGRSMSVAFVGESAKLLTDDEAFDRADDEVGIYKVYTADVDPIEIPEVEADEVAAVEGEEPIDSADDPTDAPTDSEADRDDAVVTEDTQTGGEPTASDVSRSDDATQTAPEDSDDDAAADDPSGRQEHTEAAGDDPGERRAAEDERPGHAEDQRDDDRSVDEERGRSRGSQQEDPRDETRHSRDERDDTRHSRTESVDHARERPDAGREQPPSNSRSGEGARRQSGPDRRSGSEPGHGTQTQREAGSESTRSDRSREERVSRDREPGRQSRPAEFARDSDRETRDGSGGPDPLASTQSEDTADSTVAGAALGQPGELERRSIPSVDPDRTWTAGEDGPSEPARQTLEPREVRTGRDQQPTSESSSPNRTDAGRSSSREQSGPSGQSDSSELVAELRDKERTIESLESQLADLEADRDAVAEERDELESELQSVRAERDELQSEVERLRSQVADLESQLEEASTRAVDADVRLSPGEAIDKTNLFVRYGSKGDATLKAAHAGDADREDVNANLDLEYHTQFEAETAAVDGEDFETFLTTTIQYRFVDWVVHDLLYEIRDTGHASALRDLFDALPRLDRAELNGSVSISYTEDGEQHRTQKQFDIVLRDRMGNPLAVANINDSREAATADMMSSLVTDATRVGESSDSLAGAFLVTSSFFDPGALETASEATGGGLLSRDKRESFVRLSRKQGYHLCLVEARDEKFHLAVPEL